MKEALPDLHLSSIRSLVGKQPFRFHCHPGVSCYLSCCRNVDMLLFPYDILRLKQRLGIPAEEFLHQFITLCQGSHPYFPGLKLKMNEDVASACPFLGETGCSVYSDRPSACRTYPLERGVERPGAGSALRTYYFMTQHPYCKGHEEERTYTLRQWERGQDLSEFNLYNDLWAELDAFFATNPWAGEGIAGPRQQLAFMVCYNIDGFRAYVNEHRLLAGFRLDKTERQRIGRDDGHLLRFGFQWLEMVLGGRRNLVSR